MCLQARICRMFCRFALDHVRMLRADEIFHRDCLITKFIFSFRKVIASGSLERYHIAPQGKSSLRIHLAVSWREELQRQQEPKIVDIPARMHSPLGKGRIVIPKPLNVDALIWRALIWMR
ncbi:MAG TPA: hypothetical protein VFP71_05800 [Candidatus Angelobacter sp.]|nr:hypothetical protein [Candidatus Angelobacter sp.]